MIPFAAWDHSYFMSTLQKDCYTVCTALFMYIQDNQKAFLVLKGTFSSQEKNYLQMMLIFIITPWFHWTFLKVWNMAWTWVVRCHSQG